MAIPQAVQKQLEAAEAKAKAQAGKTEPEQIPEEQQAAEVIQQPTAQPESEPQQRPQTVDYEHRFNVLQGKYNAEMSRALDEIRALNRQNQELAQRIADMSERVTQVQQQPEQTPTEVSEFLSEYPEIAKGVEKLIAQRVAQATRDLQPQAPDELVDRMHQLEVSTLNINEQRFFDALTNAVPDWETINNDQEFVAWLRTMDPYSGIPRQVMLNDARQQLDARRAIAFFSSWKEAKKGARPKTPTPPANRVQPSGNRPSSGGTPAARTYTRDDIKRFYEDVRRGKYRGREAERLSIDKDIVAAQAEGRIRP